MKPRILIISFDIPYPDNYGGVKDVWSRILLLTKLGYAVDVVSTYSNPDRLHTFERSSARQTIDLHLAFKRSAIKLISTGIPFAVAHRRLISSAIKTCAAQLTQ